MHIDESSLEGTLQVLNEIITKTLKLSDDGLAKHGIILCAGDQLTMSLLDNCNPAAYYLQLLCYDHVQVRLSRFFWGQLLILSPIIISLSLSLLPIFHSFSTTNLYNFSLSDKSHILK